MITIRFPKTIQNAIACLPYDLAEIGTDLEAVVSTLRSISRVLPEAADGADRIEELWRLIVGEVLGLDLDAAIQDW